MNRPLILVLWTLCLLSSARTAPAAEAERRPRSVFEGVAGLEKPVTLSETKTPLGELIGLVAKETGVALTAAREVADEPVLAIVKEMPARELLEQIAELLGYRWSRRSGGLRSGALGRRPGESDPNSAPPSPAQG